MRVSGCEMVISQLIQISKSLLIEPKVFRMGAGVLKKSLSGVQLLEKSIHDVVVSDARLS